MIFLIILGIIALVPLALLLIDLAVLMFIDIKELLKK